MSGSTWAEGLSAQAEYQFVREEIRKRGARVSGATDARKSRMSKSITCPIQSGTVSAESVTSKAGRSPKWHGRIPAALLFDLSVKPEAVRVYAILSLKTFQGNTSTLGFRQLGKLIGKSRSTAKRYVEQLIRSGYLKPSHGKNGQRSWYEFTSPVFGDRAVVYGAQRIGKPETPKQLTPFKQCDTCNRLTRSKLGKCRTCKADARTERIAVRVVNRYRRSELA